ncbi:MAG: hypothetical protein KJ717_00015, partial [Proteobacteria bacterium]|nr:hypothetical protein [Pseudomonadota bacterium]
KKYWVSSDFRASIEKNIPHNNPRRNERNAHSRDCIKGNPPDAEDDTLPQLLKFLLQERQMVIT